MSLHPSRLAVGITLSLEASLVEIIRAAGAERIDLVLGADQPPQGFWPSDREAEVVTDRAAIQRLAGVDVLLSAWTDGVQSAFAAVGGVSRLRWLQLTTAGSDRVVDSPLLGPATLITTTRGVHATPIAEFVIAGVLSILQRFREATAAQSRHEWSRVPPDELRGRRFGIVGYGGIGREVGRLASALGCSVFGIRRSATSSTVEADVTLLPPTALGGMLAVSDVVVLSVPLTPATRRMVGAREFAAFKPGAILVNVGRGAVVDESALVDALRSGRLRGAVLDVFEQEPLPVGHALWDCPTAIISAHVAGGRRYNERMVAFFVENLRRYLAGEPLRNVEPRAAQRPST